MTEGARESRQRDGDIQPGNLQKTVEILRTRFSSIRVETWVEDSDTALSVRFLGDGANLQERQLLLNSLAECLPPALSILGIRPEKKRDGEEATSSNGAS